MSQLLTKKPEESEPLLIPVFVNQHESALQAASRVRSERFTVCCRLLILALLSYVLFFSSHLSHHGDRQERDMAQKLDVFNKCSIQGFDKSALKAPLVEPIPFDEFVHRRDRMAAALAEEGLDAYIIEPGSDFSYLANLSGWEDWGPTERPFLLVVEPIFGSSDSKVKSKSTILTPKFELGRAQGLKLPFADGDAKHLPWREEQSPYEVLASHLASSKAKAVNKIKVTVGPETRTFISQGLTLANLEVVPYEEKSATAAVRQMKSDREVAIMRAANTLTVEAIRSVRRCAFDGISEAELYDGYEQTVRSSGPGITDVEGLTLFGERTACPHCSASPDRKLNALEDFILMDVGARLFGYISDCTRTFLLPNQTDKAFDAEKLKIWNTVHTAQTAAIDAIREGTPLSDVDLAARTVINKAGYGQYFTHRLGHSIGISMHEAPYSNSGNTKTTLKVNTPLTAEPGIYIVDFGGVRIEDVILTTAGGKRAETLTNRRANSPWDP
ncbi:hypothetical protein OC846_002230 [Tilletia horrida]|uniref:Peptidase M24 domain-containing protein n=1 Tax=Tilletia horrida TaxID=155126 RepID=A0AAN6GRR5_9BASI|nr:hypothetical protein OC845_003520 [Tilletia horrida]KAK0554141.1 hypothetical protein OC846_002230 [Tilletia horrida]